MNTLLVELQGTQRSKVRRPGVRRQSDPFRSTQLPRNRTAFKNFMRERPDAR